MVAAMWTAFIALLAIGGVCARRAVAEARGLDKLVALSNVFFAMPLAVFGAEHLAGDNAGIASLVPSYMPWRMFWVYFVGVALVAAALSIATRILVQWSGLLFGIMMFLFVAMLRFPGALSEPQQPHRLGDRVPRVVVRRRRLGSGRGAVPAGRARTKTHARHRRPRADRRAAVFYAVQHFLHPAERSRRSSPEGPARVDSGTRGRRLPDGSDPAGLRRGHPRSGRGRERWRRISVTWIVLLVVFIYGPILIIRCAIRRPRPRSRGSTTSRTRCCSQERFSGWRAHRRDRTNYSSDRSNRFPVTARRVTSVTSGMRPWRLTS